MYIGPWQELRLSQQQQSRRDAAVRSGLNIVDASHRNLIAGTDLGGGAAALGKTPAEINAGLERTLLESLPPDAVAKVLAAVQPLINDAAVATSLNSGRDSQRSLPPMSRGRRKHNHRRLGEAADQNAMGKAATFNDDSDSDRQGPTLQDHFRLPEVLRRGVGGATPSSDRGTPRSVRSSKSEPIYSSRVHREAQASKKNGDNLAEFRAEIKSGCDSATLAASLRMERNARPGMHNVPRGAQFAQFWNWDGQQSLKANKKPNAPNDRGPIQQEVNSKIARVKEMQKLYTSGALGLTAPAAPSEVSDTGVSISPTRLAPLAPTASYEKPRTPEVRDRDLTANDIAIVSKYFSSGARRLVESGATHEPSQLTQHLGLKPSIPIKALDNHGLGSNLSPAKYVHRTSPEGHQHGEIQKIPAAIALVPIETNTILGDKVTDIQSPKNCFSAHSVGASTRLDSPMNLPVTPVRTKSTAILSPIHSDGKPSSPLRSAALTPTRQNNSTRLFSPLSHNKPGSAASGVMSPEGLLQWTASLNPADLDLW